MIRLGSFAAGLILASAAHAQDPVLSEMEPEEIRRYTVEVIIFSYAQDVGLGSETFVPEPTEEEDILPAEGEPIVFDDTLLNEPEVEEPELRDLDIVLLETEQLTLTDTLERLDRLDVYEPLMHFGWTQATYPAEETPPIQLHVFGRPPPALRGELTLYLSRFLHFVVDLSLDSEQDFERVVYRIDEDRILKNGETRYYDHPRFGVIAKVTRVEEDPKDEPAV